jgi:hypothetical protein
MRGSSCCTAALLALALAAPTRADFLFSTGNPDGLMAMASRPSGGGKIEIEAADDFVTTAFRTRLTHASFTGLLTGGVSTSDINEVGVELYRIFPADSDTTRTPNVPTRVNSPSDVAFVERLASAGTLTFQVTRLGAFTANNSVLNGINPFPNQTTNGEGSVTGEQVRIDVTLSTPIRVDAGHFFFVPTVGVSAGGEFFWLSAPKPIVPPGTPFDPDLQTWIRNANLDPDWLRVGTDIVGGNPAPTFNAAFSLRGQVVPEPGGLALVGLGGLTLGALSLRRRPSRRA